MAIIPNKKIKSLSMKKFLFISLFVGLLLILGIVLMSQERIMHPKKRELQAYHFDWLKHPLRHGMDIQKALTPNHIPYLIVTQNQTQGLSKRQHILLNQVAPIPIRNHTGTLILLHGKNGRKEDLLPVAERYIALGFTCILIDLPQHGESTHIPLYYATKAYERKYVDSVLKDASHHITIDKDRLYIWGMSLGGAFAIANVIDSEYEFQAMILVATFNKLDSVLQAKSKATFGEKIGGFLYAGLEKSLALFYDFDPQKVDNAQMAKALHIPLYMTHGKQDKLISYQQGEKLFNNFASMKKHFHLDNAGDHHNILVTKHQFFKESGLFLLEETTK